MTPEARIAPPNYTPIPDVLFDSLMHDMTGAELKCFLYLCRRTFGFKRESDRISLSQFIGGIKRRDGTRLDSGTGLAKSSVVSALASLKEKGLVCIDSGVSDSGDSDINLYSIRPDRKSNRG
jgi:DNA-binding transcriptional ArsR family regulator